MKRRGFFKSAVALIGLKAFGVKVCPENKSVPNPSWVDAELQSITVNFGRVNGDDYWTIRYVNGNYEWKREVPWIESDYLGDVDFKELPPKETL